MSEYSPLSADWNTCIRLNVREDRQGPELISNFDDIQSRLLLFLHRLKQIEIKFDEKGEERVYTRYDHLNGDIIELKDSSSSLSQYWLVVKLIAQGPKEL
ncbi:unnamed protein product, partial [Didymodactylos carnosus]